MYNPSIIKLTSVCFRWALNREIFDSKRGEKNPSKLARVGRGLGDFRHYLELESQRAASEFSGVDKRIVRVVRVQVMVVDVAFVDPRLDLVYFYKTREEAGGYAKIFPDISNYIIFVICRPRRGHARDFMLIWPVERPTQAFKVQDGPTGKYPKSIARVECGG